MGPVTGPFTSLGFGSPHLPNEKVGQRTWKSPPHLQTPSKGFGTLPRGLPAPFVSQPQGWLVTALGQVSQLWPRSTREQGGGQGEVQALGIFCLVLSLRVLPHMLSPGPDACDSQGGAKGLLPCFPICRGSASRNKAAGH